MTDIARELLEGIEPGHYVRIRYGTDRDQMTTIGTVEKWSENFLYIIKEDGDVARIRLDDNLRALDQIKKGAVTSSEVLSTPSTSGYGVLRQMTPLLQAAPLSFSSANEVSKLRSMTKALDNSAVKKAMGAVLDSLTAAVKSNEVGYKYHNLRARIIQMWDDCETESDFALFYNALGILAILAADYAYALEPLVRVKRYQTAAHAALEGKLNDSAQVMLSCAMFSGEGVEIDRTFAELCAARRDVDTLRKLLEKYKTNIALCEKLASCAFVMLSESGAKLSQDIKPYDTAYDAAKRMLDAIPLNARCTDSATTYFEEFQKYTFPKRVQRELPSENKALVACIDKYNLTQKWGFIQSKYYFYIAQVRDDTDNGRLLRMALAADLWDRLEVTFSLGDSVTHPGQTAVTDMQLTENGYREAKARLEAELAKDKRLHGVVDVYYSTYENANGRIRCHGEEYLFFANDIIDPWLRAYYKNSFAPREQRVVFDVKNGKARYVCWDEPSESDREAFASTVSEVEKQEWNAFLEQRERAATEASLVDTAPYARYPYFDLPELGSQAERQDDSPLTWNGKGIVEEKNRLAKAVKAKPAEPPVVDRVTFVTKPAVPSEAQTFADQARKARISGNLTLAAELFEKALQVDDVDEKVISDYVTALQQSDRIDEALEVIAVHENQLPLTKITNLRIGLYEKKKDYASLCPLYEAAFAAATTVSIKSHNLYRLIEAYVKQKRYDEALQVCNRWETFYSQNRYSTDADKLKKASPNVSRNKAFCLYFLNQIDEARTIATDLVRANPTDSIANSILNGTLGGGKNSTDVTGAAEELSMTSGGLESESGDSWSDAEADGTVDGSGSRFSRFVRYMIQQADLSANLKSPNIRDGRYIGTPEQGKRDLDMLTGRQRVSSKTRSDMLFAACKLLEQINEDANSHLAYRLTGRAMAAWGDAMVSHLRQADTARMAYLYALKALAPGKQGMEQGWADSYNRYIKSFFMAQNGQNSLEEYITAQINSSEHDAVNTDVFVNGWIPEVLLPEFVVGILMLIHVLGDRERNSLLEDLYAHNPTLRASVCGQLSQLLGEPIADDVSVKEFAQRMFNASEQLQERMDSLNRVLTDIGNVLMRERISGAELERLEPERWESYLTAADNNRLKYLFHIVRRSQDYYASGDFDNRADCLRAVLLDVNELLQTIRKEPTDVSYDIFLPALDQMSMKLTEKQAELYQDFLPKITLEETILPFRAPDGAIQVQLTVRNGQKYQTADSFRITAVSGDEVLRFEEVPTVQSLRGGEEAEIGLRVFVDKTADASGSFTATLSCSYQCSDAPQNIITKTEDVDFNFVIRDENFKPLINPFAAFEEKVMADEEMFFGRSTQIQEISDMIYTSNGALNYGRAVAVYGQTRTGKSSLLLHLTNNLKARYGDRLLICDIGNIGKFPKAMSFMTSFMHALLRRCGEEIRKNAELAAIMEAEGLQPPLREVRSDPEFASVLFWEYMEKLNRVLEREGKMIVLIADEFTYLHGYIKQGEVPVEFMRFWKALLQDNCIFSIIVGQDDMPEFMREYPNEFACMELRKLNYLAENDAKQLICRPLEEKNNRNGLFRDDGCTDEIYKLTAGSAYLTIILCSKLVSYLNEKGAYIVTKGIVADFLRTRALGPNSFLLEKNFEPQIDERGHIEEFHEINRELLLSIARLSQTNGYASLEDITCGEMTMEEIRTYVDRLVDRNVLVKEGRDGYWIQVRLLEKWLIDTMGV